jgi:branched-chain amino acid transport system permease protein
MTALRHEFVAFTVGGLAVGALYALMAFGYTIVFRVLRLFNFAQGGVFMVATVVALFVARAFGATASSATMVVIGAIVAMTLAAGGTGAALSVGLEYLMYRPIRRTGAGSLPALVAGLGALSVMQEAVARWVGLDPIVLPVPLGGHPLATFLGGSVYPRHALVIGAGILTLVAIDRYIARSRMGRALRAVGQDAKTASLMGINVERVVLLGFVLAGATAGIAATLWDLYFGNTSWLAGFGIGIKGVTAALLGGMGSIPGALVGGLALGLMESYGGAVFGAEWQDVIAFGALVLLLLLRPTGIVGERAVRVRV